MLLSSSSIPTLLAWRKLSLPSRSRSCIPHIVNEVLCVVKCSVKTFLFNWNSTWVCHLYRPCICLSGVCISEVSEVDEGNGGVAKDVPLPPSSRPPATDNSGAFFLNSHVWYVLDWSHKARLRGTVMGHSSRCWTTWTGMTWRWWRSARGVSSRGRRKTTVMLEKWGPGLSWP